MHNEVEEDIREVQLPPSTIKKEDHNEEEDLEDEVNLQLIIMKEQFVLAEIHFFGKSPMELFSGFCNVKEEVAAVQKLLMDCCILF
ncbi:hypothetical protein NDU88_003657 [Pleurodeles waltl]|uniref:Uncharacterized protein n=1 Tax=Pleurodeles waltl TaxID=8319 RepID=A0AAV7MBQ2_PLEWA|nr:hypothetical protein NDU88_003657 [Pleurodeles waltl]